MDALKYPAHLYNTAHNFAFLANALVCILNNLAIKIWAGLFLLGIVIFKAPTEEGNEYRSGTKDFLHQEL
jgi:hypothetical protein